MKVMKRSECPHVLKGNRAPRIVEVDGVETVVVPCNWCHAFVEADLRWLSWRERLLNERDSDYWSAKERPMRQSPLEEHRQIMAEKRQT